MFLYFYISPFVLFRVCANCESWILNRRCGSRQRSTELSTSGQLSVVVAIAPDGRSMVVVVVDVVDVFFFVVFVVLLLLLFLFLVGSLSLFLSWFVVAAAVVIFVRSNFVSAFIVQER